jgi:hypothetical protein
MTVSFARRILLSENMEMSFVLTQITTSQAEYSMEVHNLLIHNRCIIGTRKYRNDYNQSNTQHILLCSYKNICCVLECIHFYIPEQKETAHFKIIETCFSLNVSTLHLRGSVRKRNYNLGFFIFISNKNISRVTLLLFYFFPPHLTRCN